MLNFLKRKPQPPSPDWLYHLIFQKVEDAWVWCARKKDSKYWQYVLIEEWSSAEGAHCRGKLLRLWRRDAQGLREIPVYSRAVHQMKITGRIYPFILISFHIYPDQTHVVFGQREANTAGRGGCYKVIGDEDNATLAFDPEGGFWIS